MQVLRSSKKVKPIVVAVSGGFDPMHAGHVRLFQEAKKLGDKLVVILNNDNWLMAKKSHIFMPQEERKEVLEALSCIDAVVLTKHPKNVKDMSVCRELLELRPHIFGNGGDRHEKNVPEVGTCEAIGCRMVFNLGEGGKIQSSSWLLNRHMREMKLREEARASSAKKVIMFDLDGTLTRSKAVLDKEMASLLCKLLSKKTVAVTSGGNYPQFKSQFLRYLQCGKEQLKNLFILPVSGGSLYRYEAGKWHLLYRHKFTAGEKARIFAAFKASFRDIKYIPPEKTYGKVLEDRESQITFSALGQKAPVDRKEEWNEKSDIRRKLILTLRKRLPEFEIRLGGLTSVDVTKKGIDKAYGIRQIMKLLSVSKKEMVYVGDALYKGGNDYVAKRAGVRTVQVEDEKEAKSFIRLLLSNLER
ncbi:MAG: HAD-IIB family hydrolase [Candidatus Colwellbacteria bacterium]|nr:HAD-IIB family hydrolase [Candidatus Colwellbacteria bacterium]